MERGNLQPGEVEQLNNIRPEVVGDIISIIDILEENDLLLLRNVIMNKIERGDKRKTKEDGS